MEYQQKPVLPPPFIAFCHFYSLLKYCIRKAKVTEERGKLKNTTERVETMAQKIEDINQKENLQTATVQNIEFRLRKMEESSEQILNHLAVIHRFMAMHTIGQDEFSSSNINIPGDLQRIRTVSMSDNEAGGTGSGNGGGEGGAGGLG
ncbi:hypothetical protein DOY81_014836, partial [Sarcophaga bullata]